MARVATALSLLAVSAGVLVESFLVWHPAAWIAGCGLVAFCLLGQRLFGRREKLLLLVSVTLVALAFWRTADAGRTTLSALDRAAFLAAFMLLLGVLRDAAQTSGAVLACGTYLTRQPPGRRYASVALGAHLLGTMLNMGALSLFAPLIRRGIEAGRAGGDSDTIAAIKERRQFTACLRGFSWMIVWAPTTVTQALLVSMFADFDPLTGVALGMCLALLAGLTGWLEDRVRWRGARRHLLAGGLYRPPGPVPVPVAGARDFALVVLALIVLSAAVKLAFGVATVQALMLTAPLLTLGWIWCQRRAAQGAGAVAATLRRGRAIVLEGFPASSPEALTLACAGFIGVMTAALVPPAWLSYLTEPGGLPPLLLLWLLPLLVVLAAQIALTPIMMVSFLGSALGQGPVLPVDANVLGLSLAVGWALAMTASPFTAGPLIVARVTGISPYDLSWRWNWAFDVLVYAVAGGFLTLVFLLTGS